MNTSSRTQYIIVAALILITLVVFLQVVRYDFVNYDDDRYVSANQYVKAGLTAGSVRWAWTAVYEATWQPMVWLSYMLDRELFGMKPMGFHLVNLLLHVANSVLLFLVLSRMTKSRWKSGFVAALFAIHPLHVESVAWIAERKDVLSAFFWMLAIWAYARYTERPTITRYLPIMLFFALGLMSKPMLVTLPLTFLLLDYWPLGRLNPPVRTERKRRWPGWVLLLEKTPLLIMAIVSAGIACYAQNAGGALGSLARIPFGVRAANGLVASAAYIVKMIWPLRLAIPYPHRMDTLPEWQVVGSGVMLTCLTVLALRGGARKRYPAAGWLWYVVTLGPVLGLIHFGGHSMADRFTYIPLIGLFVIVAWGVPDALRSVGAWGSTIISEAVTFTRPLSVLGGLTIALLSVAAWFQTSYWKDGITLFRHATEVTNDNYAAHTLLGSALAMAGRTDEGIAHLNEALRIAPDWGPAHGNLGTALAKQGNLDEATEQFRLAIEKEPGSIEFRSNLAGTLAARGMVTEAVKEYNEVLAIDPNAPNVRRDLEALLRRSSAGGKSDPAIDHFNQGAAFDAQGRLDDAIREYREAVRVNPGLAQAHGNLGVDLSEKGDINGAIREYQTAVRLKPDFAQAHNNLAVALYFKGRYAEAWKEVHLSQKYGISPGQGFLDALSEKMPETQ